MQPASRTVMDGFLRRGFAAGSLRTSFLLSHPATPRDAAFDRAHRMRWRLAALALEQTDGLFVPCWASSPAGTSICRRNWKVRAGFQ